MDPAFCSSTDLGFFFFSVLIEESQGMAVGMIGGGFLSSPLSFFSLISILTDYPCSLVKVISL